MVDRNRGKRGNFGSLSQKNYAEMKAASDARKKRKKKKNHLI